MKELPYPEWERIVESGTYEQSFEALNDVVRHLEAGELSLDDSVRCYEVGSRLARRCESLLRDAELRISRLSEPDEEVSNSIAHGSWLDDPNEM